MVREACQQWIGLAPPPEEDYVDTFSVMLIDEHADMAARFKRAGDLEGRIRPTGNQCSHVAGAHADDGLANSAEIG